jgi:class 3 adenylate cyclase/tetratricopeptide (TPR) repeat protein
VDIGQWLRGLGLQSYEQAFREHGIDLEVLTHLTVDDLKEIGIHAVGHRRKILDAIGLLPARLTDEAASRTQPAERRQLTLMFVDLVGSTELSRRLDPEELREIMRTYQDTTAGEIARLGGHVAKFLGDGVLAYFGWPRASEDAAERAVRAGLTVVKAVGAIPTGAEEPLAARVGIATGLVVIGDLIGDGVKEEGVVTGETPNLAARLQQVAEPGTVVIADSTHRLIGDFFELAAPVPCQLKGFDEPAQVWRVIGEGKAESRFEALHGAHPAPLVGRGEELGLMLSRWRQAKEGAGQVVLLSGEPGIGKSRLVLALRERLPAEPITIINYACSPHHLNSALFPFISQLEREMQCAPDDDCETPISRLESLLSEAGGEVPDDVVALFADLLGIPSGPSSTLTDISPQQRRALLFGTFLTRLERHAARGPVLVVLEDAHWLDPTSRELFEQMVDRLQRLPALLVVTYRPELPPRWMGFPHVTLLTLNRLPEPQVVALVDQVARGKALPAEVLDEILARTEGVPLFTEELTKAILEAGFLHDTGDRYVLAGPLPPLAIPATLHDSLMARLDRHAPVKKVAQIGACIGREFDHETLAAVISLPEAELAAALDRLTAAELVFRRGFPPAATYVFKHALVRDAAYESLLKRQRQELHARIATAIETRLPQLADVQPELVARHFGEAGLAEKAVPYWLRAGRLAAGRSANTEAIAHLRAGLESIRVLPPGESQVHLELSLQLALGGPLLATKGFASSEAEAAYRRSQELSRKLRSEPDLFTALRGLGFVHHVRGNLPMAAELSDEALALAERNGDAALLADAYHLAGVLAFHLGKFQSARDRLERSMEAGEYRGRYHSEVYGINMGVFCRAYIGHCDWHLGYPDRGLKIADEGLALARDVSHPFSIALALDYLAMLHQFRREPDAALRAAEEARDICAEYRFGYYAAWSSLVRAWAIGECGRLDESLPAYDVALAGFRQTGAGLRLPHYLGQLATLHRKAGDPAAGLRILAEATAIADANRESWCSAELHRERGELLIAASQEAENEADTEFLTAIETATTQGAKLLELRASVARASLQAAHGERQKACGILAPIYGWFSEGFETRDFVEARVLLNGLQ